MLYSFPNIPEAYTSKSTSVNISNALIESIHQIWQWHMWHRCAPNWNKCWYLIHVDALWKPLRILIGCKRNYYRIHNYCFIEAWWRIYWVINCHWFKLWLVCCLRAKPWSNPGSTLIFRAGLPCIRGKTGEIFFQCQASSKLSIKSWKETNVKVFHVVGILKVYSIIILTYPHPLRGFSAVLVSCKIRTFPK